VESLCFSTSAHMQQGMSYALAGMRRLDRKRYSELLVSARASDLIVTRMRGCIMSQVKLRTLADDLDSGIYDVWLRGTAASQLCAEGRPLRIFRRFAFSSEDQAFSQECGYSASKRCKACRQVNESVISTAEVWCPTRASLAIQTRPRPYGVLLRIVRVPH
jgi:hypothetical protein